MRRAFNKALRIGLSRSGIALLQTSGWAGQRIEPIAEMSFMEGDFASPERLLARIKTLLSDHHCAKLPTTVILSGDLVRLFMVTPPGNVGRLQDCRSAVEMRFQSLYGEATSGWQLKANWDASHAFLACAVPNTLLDTLHQVAQSQDLTLIELVPQFIAAWNSWHTHLHGTSWFAVANESLLTLGAMHNRRLCVVRTSAIPEDALSSPLWMSEHLKREALRFNLPEPTQLHFCGDVPGNWAEQTSGEIQYIQLGTTAMTGRFALASSGARR